jgi:integrase/recombinase XerD
MIQNYLDKISKELSENSDKTAKIYSFFIKKYLSYLESKNKTAEQANKEDVHTYLKSLNNYSYKSQALALSSLKFFYNNIIKKAEITSDIGMPEKSDQETLSKDEIKKLIDSSQTQKSRLIISFLYSTGIKVSELVNLKVTDIDLENKTVKIYKKNKPRQISFDEELCQELKNYIEEKNPQIFLFSKKERPLTTRNIQKIIKNTAKKAEFDKKITPHTLRYTYAKQLLNSGVQLSKVKSVLGYSPFKNPK